MTIEELEKDLRSGNLKNIYVLYGEEKFLLESNVKRIKKNFGEMVSGINYIQLDENNVSSLISELQTPAFGYPKKLIIVKNAKLFQKDTKSKKKDNESLKEKLCDNIENMDENNILVFIEDEVEKNELLKTIEKNNGIICEFEFQKPIQIEKRLIPICNAYKVNVASSTISYLIDVCGTNMQNLINETRKLIEYVGENGTIQNKDIDSMCIKTIDSNIFDLTDNLGKKNTKEAIKILEELLYSKEPIQKILITLYNHIKRIYIVKVSDSQKRNATQDLNLKPNQTFLVTKYRTQSKYFTAEELKNILKQLIDLDFKFKTGEIDLTIGLESILCGFCS